jgi:hypothetical protein
MKKLLLLWFLGSLLISCETMGYNPAPITYEDEDWKWTVTIMPSEIRKTKFGETIGWWTKSDGKSYEVILDGPSKEDSKIIYYRFMYDRGWKRNSNGDGWTGNGFSKSPLEGLMYLSYRMMVAIYFLPSGYEVFYIKNID